MPIWQADEEIKSGKKTANEIMVSGRLDGRRTCVGVIVGKTILIQIFAIRPELRCSFWESGLAQFTPPRGQVFQTLRVRLPQISRLLRLSTLHRRSAFVRARE